MRSKLPKAVLYEGTLAVLFPERAQVLSWAPLNPGFQKARYWINHQVKFEKKLRLKVEPAGKTLARVAGNLGFSPWETVGQMTSGDIRKFKTSLLTKKGWTVFAAGTAGFSNAVRVGEKTRHGSRQIGTINLLVWVSRPLALSTLLEISQIVVEARTLAVMDQKVKSRATGAPATGTGTDCVAVACPVPGRRTGVSVKARKVYAGKHTVLGELVGKAVLKVLQR